MEVGVMVKIGANTTREDLERVKIGDIIDDGSGKTREVENVDKLHYGSKKHFYYKLKYDGTILVVR